MTPAKPMAVTTLDETPTGTMYDRAIRVRVGHGETSTTFDIHRGLLIFYSDYFRAAIDGTFREASDREIHLDRDVDVETFDIFKGWLYTHKLRNAHGAEGDDLDYLTLFRLWVFGDRFLTPLLKNEVVDLYFAHFVKVWSIPTNHINFVYHNSPAGTALRRLLIDTSILACSGEALLNEGTRHRWSADSLWDLSKALFAKADGNRKPSPAEVGLLDRCGYHEHPKGVRCTTPHGTLR